MVSTLIFSVLILAALGYLGREDAPRAGQVVEELIELSGRYGLPAFRGYAEVIRGWVSGELASADATIEALEGARGWRRAVRTALHWARDID